MKKLLLVLLMLPVVAFAQLPKKVDLVGTLIFGPFNTTDTASAVVKTATTPVFGVDSQDSISFVVEYEISDSLTPVTLTTGPTGYSGQNVNWYPIGNDGYWNTARFVVSPSLALIKDTLSYAVAGFDGRIKTTTFTTLYANTTWLTAPTAGLPDNTGIHLGLGNKFAWSVTRMQLQLKFTYGSSATTAVKYPTYYLNRAIRAKIYKVSK